jgi:hypothetical protein
VDCHVRHPVAQRIQRERLACRAGAKEKEKYERDGSSLSTGVTEFSPISPLKLDAL